MSVIPVTEQKRSDTQGGATMALFDGTASQKDIIRIRRLGFDPKDERVIQLVREYGPERALEILELAWAFMSTLKTVQ